MIFYEDLTYYLKIENSRVELVQKQLGWWEQWKPCNGVQGRCPKKLQDFSTSNYLETAFFVKGKKIW